MSNDINDTNTSGLVQFQLVDGKGNIKGTFYDDASALTVPGGLAIPNVGVVVEPFDAQSLLVLKEDSIDYGTVAQMAVVNEEEDGFDFVDQLAAYRIRGYTGNYTGTDPDAFASIEGDPSNTVLLPGVAPSGVGQSTNAVSYTISEDMPGIVIATGAEPINAYTGGMFYWSKEQANWLYLENKATNGVSSLNGATGHLNITSNNGLDVDETGTTITINVDNTVSRIGHTHSPETIPHEIEDHTNVTDVPLKFDGYVLTWNGGSATWEARESTGGGGPVPENVLTTTFATLDAGTGLKGTTVDDYVRTLITMDINGSIQVGEGDVTLQLNGLVNGFIMASTGGIQAMQKDGLDSFRLISAGGSGETNTVDVGSTAHNTVIMGFDNPRAKSSADGSGITWEIYHENNTISADAGNTLIKGSDGKLFSAGGGTAVKKQYEIVTESKLVVPDRGYLVNSAAGITITLAASPDNSTVFVSDNNGLSETYPITIDTGDTSTIMGYPNFVLKAAYQGVEFVKVGSDWKFISTLGEAVVEDKAVSGGGIPEAPIDGEAYARKNAEWVDIVTELPPQSEGIEYQLLLGNIVAEPNKGYICDTTDRAISIILPIAEDNFRVQITDGAGKSNLNIITIVPQTGTTIMGGASFVLNAPYQAVGLVKLGTDWKFISTVGESVTSATVNGAVGAFTQELQNQLSPQGITLNTAALQAAFHSIL